MENILSNVKIEQPEVCVGQDQSPTGMECGYDAPFTSKLDRRFQCPICQLVFRSPVQTACGHRFCNACITRTIPYRNTVLTCPVDKTYTKVSEMFPDLAMEREILSLQVQCTNVQGGCLWRGELRDLEEHKEGCPKLPVACSLCLTLVPRGDLQKHQDRYEGQCSKTIIPCPYRDIGCRVETERKSMAKHLQKTETMREHCNLALQTVVKMDRTVRDLSNTLAELEERGFKQNRKRCLAELCEKGDLEPARKSLKSNTMKSSSCKIRVVLDLSWEEYLVGRYVNSLFTQLHQCYSANQRAQNPLQLYLCSFGGKIKQRLNRRNFKARNVYLKTESYEQLFPKESLVYLTSDSSNILTTLTEDKVYIIGGLVDKHKYKGFCHKIAEERGIAHAQLPIDKYLDMKRDKVFSVNQVFSMLLRYTETQDWTTTFLAEIPQRKKQKLLTFVAKC